MASRGLIVPALFVIPMGFVAGWVVNSYYKAKDLEDVRVELLVRQRLGETKPVIPLTDEQQMTLIKERKDILDQLASIQAKKDAKG